ncbi:MAG TPA: DUF1080 domain-containing protein [Fimbriimonadaceae bacterium]|nr:DUF1080 domain-containing protein [Fimbriimonadaceae bacterium]
MSTRPALILVICLVAAFGAAFLVQQQREGYRDTPVLPGQKWHVHDPDRPYPHEVVPGENGAPPSDAEVLYDGHDLSKWTQSPKDSGDQVPAKWNLRDGYFEPNPGTGDLYTRDAYGDCQLHVEWQEPEGIVGRGQGRGNSGVFLQSRYEVQVLDSYRAATYADGQAGAIYGQWPPLVNPMRKPGEWQTYDIVFTSPKFDGDKLVEPAYETVFFNGVLIHNHQKLNGPTGHAEIPPYVPYDGTGRLRLQDHQSTRPVRYRNIWIRRLKDYDQPEK